MALKVAQGIAPTPVPEPEAKVEGKKEEKKKIIGPVSAAALFAMVQKSKGTHVVTTGNKIPKVKRLATGIFEFDFYTGGGFPFGRYSIIYGPESSNKTNICYKAAASAQRLPAPCNKVVWINGEQTFDPLWASMMGVDVDSIIVVNPGYGEEAVDLVDAFVRCDDVAAIIYDSIASIVSSKEIARSAEDSDVGTAPMLVKRMVNKLVIAFAEESRKGHYPCVILVNQTRYKIGASKYENPEIQPGGQALKFLSSLTVRVSASNKIIKSINPNVHSFKETRAIIKKAKVGVLSNSFQFDLCVLEHEALHVGETDSWGTVQKHLKSLDLLTKAKKGGWEVEGMLFPTLDLIQDRYLSDPEFQLQLQGLVSHAFEDQGKLVEEPVEAVEAKANMFANKAAATTPTDPGEDMEPIGHLSHYGKDE